MMTLPHRGFTLLIAVVLTSVILAIGMALIDISYKQITLASTAKNSQHAFYAADAGLECALYYDQRQAFFAYVATPPTGTFSLGTISCMGQTVSVSQTRTAATSTANFSIPCTGGDPNVIVEVHKGSGGATAIYAYGYNNCTASDPRRVERGLKVTY